MPRVLVSSTVSRLPLGMTSVALLLLARAHGFSFAEAGVALAALGFANAFSAPIQGMLVDRVGQFWVLGLCAYGQAAVLTFLAATTVRGAVLLAALSAVAGLLVPPTTACFRAVVSTAVRDARRRDALYAMDAVITEVIFTAGPLVVALSVAVASPGAALVAAAGLSVIGTTAFITSPISRSWRAPVTDRRRARAGALSSASFRVVLTAVILFGTSMGACQVGLAALALRHAGASVAAILLALWSGGSMAGGVLYATRSWRPRYARLLCLVAVTTAPVLGAWDAWAAAPLALLAGVFLSPTVACQNVLIGLLTSPGRVTEAFTWNTAGIYGGLAAGAAIGGWLIGLSGFRGAIGLSVLAMLAAAAVARRWQHLLRTDSHQHANPEVASTEPSRV